MKRRPNLLLIMTDQQRADAAGFANAQYSETPALDALAAKGVVFTNAYSASTTCVPARSALLTGIFAPRLPRGPDGRRASSITACRAGPRRGTATAPDRYTYNTPSS